MDLFKIPMSSLGAFFLLLVAIVLALAWAAWDRHRERNR